MSAGVGGTIGAFATGLFAQKLINPSGSNGLFFGNAPQLMIQSIGIIAAILYSVIVTFVILKILDMAMGLRVTDEEEVIGLDITQHEESAYTILD